VKVVADKEYKKYAGYGALATLAFAFIFALLGTGYAATGFTLLLIVGAVTGLLKALHKEHGGFEIALVLLLEIGRAHV
jgi:hypothetical protein